MAEYIVEQFKTGFEVIEAIKIQVVKIPRIEERVDGLTKEMAAVKAVLKATHNDLRGHEQRITKLENTVYHA